MLRAGLHDADVARIDEQYKGHRQTRLGVAHPTCLFGDPPSECDHSECEDDDKIAAFIKENQSLNKPAKATVDMCVRACSAAAGLVGPSATVLKR